LRIRCASSQHLHLVEFLTAVFLVGGCALNFTGECPYYILFLYFPEADTIVGVATSYNPPFHGNLQEGIGMSETSEELSNWKPGPRDDEDWEDACGFDENDCSDCCCCE